MITIIDALNESKFTKVLDEVYQLRARVFSDRLGWGVEVQDGREIDLYDSLNPVFLVCLDDDGDVVGCVRLLQTTGPHMLTDIFSELLDDEPPIRSAQVWEATRFCIDTEKLAGGHKKNSISRYTSELMLGVFEYAQSAGILDIVGVIDPVMNRIMQRSGNAPYDYMGSTKSMGVVNAMVALMDCSDERIASIRKFAGIEGDIFISEEDALRKMALREIAQEMSEVALPGQAADLEALSKPGASITDLREYCFDQLAGAESEKDMSAAVALMQMLSEKIGSADVEELQRIASQLPKSSISSKGEVLRSV